MKRLSAKHASRIALALPAIDTGGGHHASERYGAPAVAAYVAAQLGLQHEFVDIDNPA